MESYIRYSIMIVNLYIIIVVSTANARKLNKSYNETSADNEVFKTHKDDMVTQAEYKAKNKNYTNLLTKYDYSEKNIELEWSRSYTREQKGNTTNHLFQSVYDIPITRNYFNEKSNESFKSIIGTLTDKNLIRMLCVVYIILAVPLWCTRGWCCCFLFCKIFKPEKTIEEAKKFVVLNPPGVLLHRDTVIHYEPSDNERHCYQKFEHLIRTI